VPSGGKCSMMPDKVPTVAANIGADAVPKESSVTLMSPSEVPVDS